MQLSAKYVNVFTSVDSVSRPTESLSVDRSGQCSCLERASQRSAVWNGCVIHLSRNLLATCSHQRAFGRSAGLYSAAVGTNDAVSLDSNEPSAAAALHERLYTSCVT